MTVPSSPASRTQRAQERLRAERAATVLVNRRSSRSAARAGAAIEALREAGYRLTVRSLRDPRDLGRELDRIMADPPALLIAGGGDGTLSHVAARIARTETVLGVLPFGTTNNLARSLGVPTRLPGAIEVLLAGNVVDVDLASVNGVLFANVAGIGVSAEVAAAATTGLKRRFGRAAYVLAGIRVLATHRPFTAHVELDGHRHRIRTHQLVVANGRSHGGVPVAPDASIDDRHLDVFPLGGASRIGFLADLIAYIATGLVHPVARTRRARAVSIDLDAPHAIEADGEHAGATPAVIRVEAEALLVLAPADLPGTTEGDAARGGR